MTPSPAASSGPLKASFRSRIGRGYRPEAAHADGKWRNDNSGDLSVTAGQNEFSLVFRWRPQQDSNLRTRLRRPLLYPLSYGGWRTRSARTVVRGRLRKGTSPRQSA